MAAKILLNTLIFYGSVCAMPIITIFLLEQDGETLDSFYTSLWHLKKKLYFQILKVYLTNNMK